jgi:hypothetical protein
MYPFAAAGGLLSYGGDIIDQFRQGGIYTGRILKGEKPADLPVQQSTKIAEVTTTSTQAAAGTLGLQLHVLHASTEPDIDSAFATLVKLGAGGIVIGGDTFFYQRSASCSSISRLPRRLASLSRSHSSAAPTRSSSETPRINRSARRRGSMADRGAGATAQVYPTALLPYIRSASSRFVEAS